MKTLQDLEAGDIITDGDEFMKVIIKLGGEGELTCYLMSQSSNVVGVGLKSADAAWTVYDLEENDWKFYETPEDKTEKLVEEYRKNYLTSTSMNEVEFKNFLRDFAKDLLSK